MVPSSQRDTHKTLGDFHPLMCAVPTLLESSSSWHAPLDNRPSPTTLSNYQNLLYLTDLGKLTAIIFVNRHLKLENLLHLFSH